MPEVADGGEAAVFVDVGGGAAGLPVVGVAGGADAFPLVGVAGVGDEGAAVEDPHHPVQFDFFVVVGGVAAHDDKV